MAKATAHTAYPSGIGVSTTVLTFSCSVSNKIYLLSDKDVINTAINNNGHKKKEVIKYTPSLYFFSILSSAINTEQAKKNPKNK